MNTINHRIKELVDFFSAGNNSDFASRIGTSEANIRNYINGTQPKYNIIEKIINTFELNFEWLFTGKGDMIKKERPISERLVEFIHYKKLSPKELGKALGYSVLEIAKVTAGDMDMDEEHINKLGELYPDLNIGWLRNDEGVMLKDGTKQSVQYETISNTPEVSEATNTYSIETEVKGMKDIIKAKDEIIAIQKELIEYLKTENTLLKQNKAE